jgi:trimeric autotransporter adhesin
MTGRTGFRQLLSQIAMVLFCISFLIGCGGGGSSTSGKNQATGPIVSSISPNTVQAGVGNTTLSVSGSNFVSASIVTFNGKQLPTTYISASLLSAVIPASDLTSGDTVPIGVTNPNSSPSTTVLFQIDNPVPVLAAITPNSVQLGSSGTFMLTGTGFVPASTVLFNNSSRTPTYVSGTTLQLSLSASDLAAAANDMVAVVNSAPAGGSSQQATLQVTQLIPSVSAVSPQSIQLGVGNVPVTVSGTNFSSSATVQVNGTSLSTTVQTATSITVTLPSAMDSQAGTLSLSVTNPGTNSESSAAVTVNILGTPVISSVSPAAAAIGSSDLPITITGSNFLSGSVVQLNGQELSTQYTGAGQLTATIPALDLATFSNSSLVVSTPVAYPAGNLVSASQTFSTYLALPNNNIVYNPSDGFLYASVPGSVGGSMGNTIVGIDPVTGNIMRQIPVGSEPNKIAISDDGTQLFVGLDGAGAVRQVNLTTGQPGQQFSLGGGPGVYNPPYTAEALAVLPGEPNSVAVFSSNGIVTIYDSGVARPNTSSGLINVYFDQNFGSLSFGASASTLYISAGPFQGLVELTLNSTGIVAGTNFPNGGAASYVGSIQYDNGRLYIPDGVVLDAASGSQLGTFSVTTNQPATGPIVSDSTLDLAFIGYFGSNLAEVLAFNEGNFNPTGNIDVTGTTGSFQEIARWGQDGVALATINQIYALQSSIVKDLSSSPADLSVGLTAPSTGNTGTPIAYAATIQNHGPNQASGVVFVSTMPDSVIVNSVNTSAGTCGAGSEVVCNLGNLASGSTATVTFNLTPESAGQIESTGSVSAVSYDPTPSNNQATASTTISGGLYSAVPVLSSISPAIVQSSSGSFTLTVTGSGFNSSSTINANGTSLATTYVSNTQLTATVTASLSANYGWIPITVSNPSPGGGASQIVPLTVYAVVNVPANGIQFDPYTRNIFATLPSSSTQLTGNSVVAVNPVSGSVGTPVSVGSEPNVMAETADGQYLYIGLSGANSVARFSVPTQTLAGTYPLTYQGSGVAATWLSAMPGTDNTLAVDVSNIGTVGIFDITGTSGAFRTNFTGIYEGNFPTFADATHFYTFDNYTTGAEFYRFLVDANGATLIDGTTLDGMGGFGGSFVLANGTVYGGDGGIVNPSTTPPSQIATLSTLGLFGAGVAPDPSTAKNFMILENAAGQFSYALTRYNTTQYVVEAMLPLPVASDGGELAYSMSRWGQDGLALLASEYNYGNSQTTAEILLLRGPFVLPSELTANPVPVLTSLSPSPIAVDSGNTNFTIVGSNFLPGAVALWSGQPRTTTFVDSAHLEVAIPASDLTSAKTVNITTANAGSGLSNALSLSVQ